MRFGVIPFLLVSTVAVAEERFYTTVDAQGRVQVVKGQSSDKQAQPEAKAEPGADKAPQLRAEAASQVQADKKPEPDGMRQLDKETYIDSEVLEKKQFNPEGKKRFYFLPDGSSGSKVVESEGGVSRIVAPEMFASVSRTTVLSPKYQQLDTASVLAMYNRKEDCFDAAYLKAEAKPLKDKNNIWVRPGFERSGEADAVLALSNRGVDNLQLRLESFATTYKRPSYYLPVVVFLDNKGCVLSGAWQYWSGAYPASDKLYASIDGLLTVPVQSAYILFYRPVNTLQASIPMNRKSGSFVVEVYTKRSP